MKKLKIFYPKNSISFDKTTIILLVLLALLFVLHFLKKIYPEDLDDLYVLLIVFTFFYFIFHLINDFFRQELVNGTFSGYLIIENDKIICDKKTYLINDIDKINIYDESYQGQFNGKLRSLEAKRSNGLDNIIKISQNNTIDTYNFLQTKTENIKIFKNELRGYVEKGLLEKEDFEELMK